MQLSDEQRMIRDSVREFVRERIAPYAADWDREGFEGLCRTLAGVDPFFRSLVETREELVQVFNDSLGK